MVIQPRPEKIGPPTSGAVTEAPDIADGSGSPHINEDESSIEHRYDATRVTIPLSFCNDEVIVVASHDEGSQLLFVHFQDDTGADRQTAIEALTAAEARQLAAALTEAADRIDPPASDETAVRLLAEHYQHLGCPGTVDPNDPEDRLNVAAESVRVLRQAGFLRIDPSPPDPAWEQAIREARARPQCSQCGQPWETRACGPTHAIIKAAPVHSTEPSVGMTLDDAYACYCGRTPACATGEGCDPDDA